ncbi:MAG: winged helix-turn-helix domain-containing protein, partial [Halobacteriota archaeon]|nr:winged helix-turn-helix domain-containing protein [Halobacteriota archaeon]
MFTEFCGIYEKASDWLRLLGRSEIRIKVLILLIEGTKKMGELREHLGLPSPTILHAMRAMEDQGLIKSEKRGYTLTNIGMIQAMAIKDLIETIAALFENKKFWLKHDLSGVPYHLLKRIGVLEGCEVVKATPDDLLKPLSSFVQLSCGASELKGVIPVLYPGHTDMIRSLLVDGAKVELVLSNMVFERVMEGDSEYLDLLKGKISSKELKLWVSDEDTKVSFSVTDSVLSLFLFLEDGTYDASTELVSYSDEALKWGRELLSYYIERAKE